MQNSHSLLLSSLSGWHVVFEGCHTRTKSCKRGSRDLKASLAEEVAALSSETSFYQTWPPWLVQFIFSIKALSTLPGMMNMPSETNIFLHSFIRSVLASLCESGRHLEDTTLALDLNKVFQYLCLCHCLCQLLDATWRTPDQGCPGYFSDPNFKLPRPPMMLDLNIFQQMNLFSTSYKIGHIVVFFLILFASILPRLFHLSCILLRQNIWIRGPGQILGRGKESWWYKYIVVLWRDVCSGLVSLPYLKRGSF